MASQSMADYLKTAGWLVLVGWWLTPIISLLVNKLFAYLFFDVSRKFRNLETITVPDLEQTLRNVHEQRMRRSFEDTKEPLSVVMTLAKIEEDLKSAFYGAQDIMDIVDYHRAEEEAVGHASSWVQHRLAAAGACIARCFTRSWFWLGRWIDVSRAVVLKCALSLYQLGRFIIQGLVSRMLSAVDITRVKLLQCAQSLCHQHLLPVSIQTPDSGSRGSMVGPVCTTTFEATTGAAGELGGPQPPLQCPADKLVEEEDEKVKGEIEQEEEEEQKGAPCQFMQQFFQSILTLSTNVIVVVSFIRDWPYEVVSIKSNQRGEIAVYSFFPPLGTNSLRKRIEHIENILDDSKKSILLNQQSSSSEIPVKDSNKRSSSNSEISINDTKKKSSSREEQIDDLHRKIERKVFGRDKELQCICQMFRSRPHVDRSKPYSVLGVHGIAGSGKSTLSYYICDHEKKAEDKYFDLIMFSHVSVTFRVDKIFRDMLREITKDQNSDSMDIKTLRTEVIRKLKEKRFLLVLDDVWFNDKNQKEQDILLDALCAGQNGSVILVTAQRKDAAAALGAQEQMLIPDLEDKEYLSLFMHHALQSTFDHDGKFRRIGRTIAKKLHRSPIAAVAVGRRLQAEKSISFWETIANLDVLNETMGALWWSYQQLGVDTRRCFQYCSTFPKGYRFKRDELVRIWIALGFIKTGISNATEELEDVGHRYLQELVKFSFLQDKYYNMEGFTIHDLLHELAERVAGSDFFRIDDLNVLPAKDFPPCVRDLFIRSKNAAQGAQTAEKNLDQLGNLRTLIIEETYTSTNKKQRRYDSENFFDPLFRRLRKLRVLIIILGSNFNPGELSFPASIDQMKHLRYISFRCHRAYEAKLILPSTFNKLYQMQTIFFALGTYVSYPDG